MCPLAIRNKQLSANRPSGSNNWWSSNIMQVSKGYQVNNYIILVISTCQQLNLTDHAGLHWSLKSCLMCTYSHYLYVCTHYQWEALTHAWISSTFCFEYTDFKASPVRMCQYLYYIHMQDPWPVSALLLYCWSLIPITSITASWKICAVHWGWSTVATCFVTNAEKQL